MTNLLWQPKSRAPAHLHVLDVARAGDVRCCACNAAAHPPHQLAGRVFGAQQLALGCSTVLDLLLGHT